MTSGAFRPLDALPKAPNEPDDEPQLPRRRIWPALLVALVLVAGVGGFVWRLIHTPEPLKVLLAIDLDGPWWEGSESAAILADSLSSRLESMGFTVVRGGDPKVMDILAKAPTAEAAAAELKAAWVIETDFALAHFDHPIDGGFIEERAEGTVTVHHVGDAPVSSDPVNSWAGAKKKNEALRMLGDSLTDRVFDAALPLLVDHPALRDAFHAGPSSPDARLADKLRKAREYVEARAAALEKAEKRYTDAAAAREKAQRGRVAVTFHSEADAHDGLGGIGEPGALVKSEATRPFFIPERQILGRIDALESLVWLSPSGDRKTLWTGYNLYAYPIVGGDGKSALLVEDLFGWAKTVTRVTADGKAIRLTVDPTHRFSGGRISPDGRRVAVLDRPCGECPESLLLLDGEDGTQLHVFQPDGGAFGGWLWLDDTTLAVLYAAGPDGVEADSPFREPGPRSTLYAVKVDGPMPVGIPLWRAEDGERLAWLGASAGVKRLVFQIERTGADQIGVFDRETKSVTRLEPGRCSAPSISPDGQTVAYQWLDPDGASGRAGNDEEVGVIRASGGKGVRLTDNDERDRYPQFSADGSRIYFESLSDDPNFPRDRDVSRIASVPFDAGLFDDP